MAKLFNLARMTTATTGTGTITLGSAVSGFLSFASAGVANGDVVAYAIQDGANSEVGTGTYTSAGTTLTRTVLASTNAGSAINLSGSAQVAITALKEQIANLGETNNFTAAMTVTTIDLGGTTDTTLSRSSAGVLAVEGVTVSLNSTSAVHTASTIELGAATDTTIARQSAGHLSVEGSTIWDSGNDGTGSGLDADLLDGKNTGTSGNVVPLLDGANTWSALQTFSLGTAAANEPIRVVNTTNAASVQVAQLEGDRSAPAANDEAYISHILSDSAGNQDEFARTTWRGIDVTSGSNDARLIWSVAIADTLTEKMQLEGSVLSGVASDGLALGSATLPLSDLYLASGAIIDFANNDARITHSSNLLALTGADLQISDRLSMGAAPQTNSALFLNSTITPSGTEGAALQLSPNFTGTTTGTLQVIAAVGNIQNASVTVTSAICARIETWVKGASVTVTNAYGLYVEPQTIGGTINRSIFVSGGVSEFDGQLIAAGTSTNDNAAAGDIGEIIESEVQFGGAISLTTNTAANVTSISLTAGDWDVWGLVNFNPAGSTTSTFFNAWTSTTSATLPTTPNKGGEGSIRTPFTGGNSPELFAGLRRFSLSSTTTVYLSTYVTFATSTMQAWGYIGARRVR